MAAVYGEKHPKNTASKNIKTQSRPSWEFGFYTEIKHSNQPGKQAGLNLQAFTTEPILYRLTFSTLPTIKDEDKLHHPSPRRPGPQRPLLSLSCPLRLRMRHSRHHETNPPPLGYRPFRRAEMHRAPPRKNQRRPLHACAPRPRRAHLLVWQAEWLHQRLLLEELRQRALVLDCAQRRLWRLVHVQQGQRLQDGLRLRASGG